MSILLWLEGPLQSWGADSRFGRRDTLKFPSRSGIMGLILSALGAKGSQEMLLQELSEASLTVYGFCSKKYPDRYVPLLRDFHMVGSGYDNKDLWEKYHIPKTIDGKPAVGGGSKMTYRYYIQDAVFAAVLDIDEQMEGRVEEGLCNPVFALHLGRKNCIPTEFIFQGRFMTKDDAKERMTTLANQKGLLQRFSVEEGEYEGDVLSINDVPICFGEFKHYRDRTVTVISS